MVLPALVVFGPQTTWPTADILSIIRSHLLKAPCLEEVRNAIVGLPELWKSLCSSDSTLQDLPGERWSAALKRWLHDDSPMWSGDVAPNTLATPLTIIIHTTQLLCELESTIADESLDDLWKSLEVAGVQGFCTGFLTAAALASSRSLSDFGSLAAKSIRLAFCVGAYADLNGRFGHESNEDVCLAVRLTANSDQASIANALQNASGSYVSVLLDEDTVTLTVRRSSARYLTNLLSKGGLTVKPIGLNGHFHSPTNAAIYSRLLSFCNRRADLQLPDAKHTVVPLRSNIDACIVQSGALHELALESLLLRQSNWHATVKEAVRCVTAPKPAAILSLGFVECLPRTVHKDPNFIIRRVDLNHASEQPGIRSMATPSHDAVAIIGMSCRFPGANSLESYWDVITSGKSLTRPVPEDRFAPEELHRDTGAKGIYMGNFIEEPGAFDHRFFKKSSREAMSMDPQQRLLLQVAYEAVEDSGYFRQGIQDRVKDVGCYVGIGSVDYDANVASHRANAFSLLGTLRAFIPGRVSHHFGWTGPSVAYDTACSSSAVAIHSACKAIVSGECSLALAGGVNVITSPAMYQNLAAASFLSPTGGCKAFDTKADGYCRGEGAGVVVLKKLSEAMSDGDDIYAVIGSSAVGQNENCTPIMVPHAPSQSHLYRKVVAQAGLTPGDITYVEAHGTGTQAGDPVECSSIRDVFGGANRRELLCFGSVKGNIGHTEGASGVAALIKVVLMIQHGVIPKQANFEVLSSKIPPLGPSKMEVPLSSRKWEAASRIACINNYGAAGSNASIIVSQPPRRLKAAVTLDELPKQPLFVSAHTPESLRSRCQSLNDFVKRQRSSLPQQSLLALLSRELCTKQNRDLDYNFSTTVSDFDELTQQLDAHAQRGVPGTKCASLKPVVLAFAGQTGENTSGLSRDLFESSPILRSYLEQCNAAFQALTGNSLFPHVFQQLLIQDTVMLHALLFATQYACAMTWIDSGLHVDTVVGHSFGQLTALCVSGALSVQDGVKLVVGRAQLIRQHCNEKGAMLSVEADGNTVSKLISLSDKLGPAMHVEIACFNASTSHVLVGTEASINALEELIARQQASLGPVKWKRLDIPKAYHSRLMDGILPGLHSLATQLDFKVPTIALETCTKEQSWSHVTPELIVQHARSPVYFTGAIDRITRRLGSCHWIDAGPGGPILNMIRRALGTSSASTHSYYSAVVVGPDAVSKLASTTVELWQAGHNVNFWPHQAPIDSSRLRLTLPPYQFEKVQHWLQYREGFDHETPTRPSRDPRQIPRLLSFVKFENAANKQIAHFSVDPESHEFISYVSGHAVLGRSLCPASLYIELAAQAALILNKNLNPSQYLPIVENLDFKAPLGLDADSFIMLKLSRIPHQDYHWTFTLSSSTSRNSTSTSQHAIGKVRLNPADTPDVDSELVRYARLIEATRYNSLLTDPEATAVQGPLVYKLFNRVVEYRDYYRGVRSVSSKRSEVAGMVALPGDTVTNNHACNPVAVDNFLQVTGLHINCLKECRDNEVYVCTRIGQLRIGSEFRKKRDPGAAWVVYSNDAHTSGQEVVSDIFVFEPDTHAVVMTILGVKFTRILMESLVRSLTKANTTKPSEVARDHSSKRPLSKNSFGEGDFAPAKRKKEPDEGRSQKGPRSNDSYDSIRAKVGRLLSDVADVPTEHVALKTTFDDLGIDSLMITEVCMEIRKRFGSDLTLAAFQDMHTVDTLCQYLAGQAESADEAGETSTSSEVSVILSGRSTPLLTSAAQRPQKNTAEATQSLKRLICGHLELPTISKDTVLVDAGLDSLLAMEVCTDIEKLFAVKLDVSTITTDLTFGGLCSDVFGRGAFKSAPSLPITSDTTPAVSTINSPTSTPKYTVPLSRSVDKTDAPFSAVAITRFAAALTTVDSYVDTTRLTNFSSEVYPRQMELVTSYVVDAFEALGCSLRSAQSKETLRLPKSQKKHAKVMQQYCRILQEAGYVDLSEGGMRRTRQAIPTTPPSILLTRLLDEYPQHASEHKLLSATGSRLAECLSGAVDPVHLIFANKDSKLLLEDVYTNAPMFATGTKVLSQCLLDALENVEIAEEIRILELGAGTGGTTKHLLEQLASVGARVSYTFSDLSPSLVAAAKKKFARYDFVKYMVVDVESSPPPELLGKFHIVLSTNCIHATKDLVTSTSHIGQMLRPDGIICLVELTRNLDWFDLVFGLLEGWWLFDDGRKHVLADEHFWKDSLIKAGFTSIDWSDGDSEESDLVRVIVACRAEVNFADKSSKIALQPVQPLQETLTYKQVGHTSLEADVYYPAERDTRSTKRPLALMIHGGGHVMLSRKDIRPKQTQILLDKGFLPVSIDYRLCPEISLVNGAMCDVRDALRWAREELPLLQLRRSDILVDGECVVAVGWSTGGTLAMSLGWTSPRAGLEAPNAILAFYCPLDYESSFWVEPNVPRGSESTASLEYDLQNSLFDQPITSYNIPPPRKATGGWLSLSDPRSRVALHMNWKGQTLPFLCGGVTKHDTVITSSTVLPQPPIADIRDISPLAHIRQGDYHTPTYIIHPTNDDLIPWQQAQDTYSTLQHQEVPTKLDLLDDEVHLFDLSTKMSPEANAAVLGGYDFLRTYSV